jgi:hypothetical protein
MEEKEIRRIFYKNAFLGLQLSQLEPERLAKVKVYLPDALPPKFFEYCERIGLKKKPALVVGALYDDTSPFAKDASVKSYGQAAGNYIYLGNSVWLPQENYDLFEANNPIVNYSVAHELGHAANGYSRRKFLGLTAAVTGAGLAGAGAWTLTGAALDAKPLGKREWGLRDTSTTLVQGVLAWAVARESRERLVQAYWPSLRADELSADDYAKKIVDLHGVVYPQLINIIAEHKQRGSTIISNLSERLKKSLAEQSLDLSLEEENLYFALYLVRHFDQYRVPIKPEDLRDAYPDFVDRINYQREWIEQALAPKLQGPGR